MEKQNYKFDIYRYTVQSLSKFNHAKGKANEASTSSKHRGVVTVRQGKQKIESPPIFLGPHPLPCQVSCFVLESRSLAILSARSTIK